MSDTNFELSANATKGRIDSARGRPTISREWDEYPFIFNLSQDPTYWKGKKILDVGSGTKFFFPEATFPGATVYAIDPEFPPQRGTRISYNTAHDKRLGVAEEIPYDDGKFDLILSSHAVPQHIPPVNMSRAVSEMLRVMKATGEIRLCPCAERDISAIRRPLEEAGFEIDTTQKGRDGPITIIRASRKIRQHRELAEQLNQKREAWKNYHQQVCPKDELRYSTS